MTEGIYDSPEVAQEVLDRIKEKEEVERCRRMEGNEAIAKLNAAKTSSLLKTMSEPALMKGTPKYTRYLEERERKRRIELAMSDSIARIRARDAALVKQGGSQRLSHVTSAHKSYEDTQPIRSTYKECRKSTKRKQRKHLAAWQQKQSHIGIIELCGITMKALVYYGTRFCMNCIVWLMMFSKDMIEVLLPIAETAAIYVPCFSVMALCNVAEKATELVHVIFGVSLADVLRMEEIERKRRMREDVGKDAMVNAVGVSSLVRLFQFPFNKFGVKYGFLKYTKNIEEKERRRRLRNEGEELFKRLGAHQIAAMIHDHSLLVQMRSKLPDTRSMEEMERTRRLNDVSGSAVAQWNAREVASLVRKVVLPFPDTTFAKLYVRCVEEKERKYRMRNPDQAMQNARNLSNIFSSSLFFKGDRITHHGDRDLVALSVGEKGKKELSSSGGMNIRHLARLARNLSHSKMEVSEKADKEEQKSLCKINLAAEQAENIGQIISKDVDLLEENEREFRIADKLWQKQAISNAQKVSNILKAHRHTPTPSRHFLSRSTEQAAANTSSRSLLDIPQHLYVPDVDNFIPQYSPRSVGGPTPVNTPRLDEAGENVNSSSTESEVGVPPKPTTPDQSNDDSKLIEGVRKLHDLELKSAQKEVQKAQQLSGKKDLYSAYRKQHHEILAEAHMSAAERHSQFLRKQSQRSQPDPLHAQHCAH